MQGKREIPVIVNEKIVIKCWKFQTLGWGTSLLMTLGNRRTDLHALEQFFILDEKLFMWTQMKTRMRTRTLQSEAIMS